MTSQDPNPYEAPKSQPQPADVETWAPFQSSVVREIAANMTQKEKSSANWRGGLYGLWVAFSVGMPSGFVVIGLAAGAGIDPVLGTIACLLVAIHVYCLPRWLQSQRRFLSSTEWARRNNIHADSLKLFGRK